MVLRAMYEGRKDTYGKAVTSTAATVSAGEARMQKYAVLQMLQARRRSRMEKASNEIT